MKKLTADVFIVPNPASFVEDLLIVPRRENEVFDLNATDLMLQVWIISAGCDNWARHGGPVRLDYLPLRVLVGVEEGSQVVVNIPKDAEANRLGEDIELTLKACQLQYRYAEFGDFRQVLDGVCTRR